MLKGAYGSSSGLLQPVSHVPVTDLDVEAAGEMRNPQDVESVGEVRGYRSPISSTGYTRVDN